jgi:hypothetical protein
MQNENRFQASAGHKSNVTYLLRPHPATQTSNLGNLLQSGHRSLDYEKASKFAQNGGGIDYVNGVDSSLPF